MKTKNLIVLSITITILISIFSIILTIINYQNPEYQEPFIEVSSSLNKIHAVTGSYCDSLTCVDKEIDASSFTDYLIAKKEERVYLSNNIETIKAAKAYLLNESFDYDNPTAFLCLDFNNTNQSVILPPEAGKYIIEVKTTYQGHSISYFFKVEIKETMYEEFKETYSINSNQSISFTFRVPYIKNKSHKFVNDLFLEDDFNLTDFISNLNKVKKLPFDESILYKYNPQDKIYGNEEFYAIVCKNDKNNNVYVAKEKDNVYDTCSFHLNDLENVSMKIKEGTLSSSSATIIITDTSNQDYIYGESYYLEKYSYGAWIEVPITFKGNHGFNSIGYSINSKTHTLELKKNWEWLYGKLPQGNYRLITSTSKPGDIINHYLSAEFIIE